MESGRFGVRMSDQTKDDFAALFDADFMQVMVQNADGFQNEEYETGKTNNVTLAWNPKILKFLKAVVFLKRRCDLEIFGDKF